MNADTFVFFATVVDAGSFVNAARKLGVDRSNVSRRIRDLERGLGAELLRRTTRSMRLTDIGVAFYERCVQIRTEVAEAQQVVRSLDSAIRGPLHISCGSMLARLHINSLLWEFSVDHPEVSVSVTLRNDVVDFVRESVDVALRVTDDPGSTVVARELSRVRWDICASPDYLRRHGSPKVPEDLARHAWLGVRHKPSLELVQGDQLHRVAPTTRVSCVDYSILRDAALAGLGIGLVPSYATHLDFAERRLKPLLTSYKTLPSLGTRLWAITPHSRYIPSQVRCFLDFLRLRLHDQDWKI